MHTVSKKIWLYPGRKLPEPLLSAAQDHQAEPGQYLDGRPPGKTRLLLEEVLVGPAGGAHPVVCVGPNALV